MIIILHQSADRQGNVQCLNNLSGCLDLKITSIDNQQVGKARPLLQQPEVPPIDDLLHRVKVTYVFAQTEGSIILLAGLAVPIYHHTTDIMRTGDMRVIKQLNTMNLLLQKIAKLLHPLIAPAFLALYQLELLFMRIFGIGKHHVHQLQLISAKRLQYLRVQNFLQMRNIIFLWY